MTDDELTGIFDRLSPSDFDRPTSAVVEDEVRETNFDDFVESQFRAIRYAFAASSGDLDPLATISSKTIERVFAADDDETLGAYIDRIAREASTIGANRVFIFRKTVVGKFIADKPLTTDSTEAMQKALDAGETQEAVYWYAQDRETNTTRHGFIAIEGMAALGEVFEAPPQTNIGFSRILGG